MTRSLLASTCLLATFACGPSLHSPRAPPSISLIAWDAAEGRELGQDPVIAVGGTQRVLVLEKWSETESVSGPARVESLDPRIIEVVDGGNLLRGRALGRARLLVSLQGRSHEVEVDVAAPARVELTHASETATDHARAPVYLSGGTVEMDVALYDEKGRRIYGADVITPSDCVVDGPAVVGAVRHGSRLPVSFNGAGSVGVTILGTRKSFEVVERTAVARVELAARTPAFGDGCMSTAFDVTDVRVSRDLYAETVLVFVRARLPDGRIALGSPAPQTLSSDVCKLRPTSKDTRDLLHFYGSEANGFDPHAHEVVGYGHGKCSIGITIGKNTALRDIFVR